MRSPFFSYMEDLGASAADGGRPRLRLIAINNQTDCLMTSTTGLSTVQHQQSLTPKELSDTIPRPASSWTGMP
jgi:hypothetical protein